MGSRATRPAFRRPVGTAFAVWAVAFILLTGSTAIACNPEAKLTVDNRTPYVGQMVHFDASGSRGRDGDAGEIVAYKFDFGDGTGTKWQSSPKASYAYPEPGKVTASVTVKDKQGDKDSASVTLRVRPLPPPVPDLVPVFAAIDPSHPTEGDSVNVTAVLLNQGNGTAQSARVNVFDWRPNGTVVQVGTATVLEPITPLATYDVTVGPFLAVAAGNHTLQIVVANVTPKPIAVGNNTLNLTMVVLPRVPEVPEVVPVAAVLDPGQPLEGDSVNVTVFLLNRGDAAADSVTIAVTDHRPDGTRTYLGASVLAAPLAPLAVGSVAFGPFQATGVGDHILEIRVTNVTPEEIVPGNATLNLTMTVASAPPPPATDLVPAFAEIDPSHPTEGNLVNLTVVLLNQGTETIASANVTVWDVRPNGTSVVLGSAPVPVPLPPATVATVVFGPFPAKGVGSHTLRIVVTNVSPPPVTEGSRVLNLTMIVTPSTPPPSAKYPDLTPIAGTAVPSQPAQGAAVNLTVFVLNRGQATATAANLEVYDGTPNGTAFLGTLALPSPLAPSAVETVSFGPFQATDEGHHVLQIIVTDVSPPENVTGDNVLSISMTVTSALSSPGQGGTSWGTFDIGALVIAGLVGAGIAAAVGAAVYFLRPSPADPMEPPPPDPPDRSPRPIWPP